MCGKLDRIVIGYNEVPFRIYETFLRKYGDIPSLAAV